MSFVLCTADDPFASFCCLSYSLCKWPTSFFTCLLPELPAEEGELSPSAVFFFLTPGFSLCQCLSVSVCLFLLCTGPCREVPVGAGGGAVWGSPGSNPAAGCMYLIRKETTKFIITSSAVKVLMNLVCVNNTAYIRLIMLVCRGTLALVWSYFGFLSHNFAFPSFI